MSSHRYWRLTGLSAQGSDSNLALTEIKLLFNSLSVSDTITPTSNHTPSSGSLANLVDNDLTTSVVFLKNVLFNISLVWDFGSNKEVTDIQFGSSLLQSEFVLSSILQFSNDGLSWLTYAKYKAPKWPGPDSLTTSSYANSYWDIATTGSNPPIAPDGTFVSPVSAKTIKGSTYRQSGICQFEVKFNSLTANSGAGSIIYLGIGITSDMSTSDVLQNDREAYAIYSTQAPVFAGVTDQTYGGYSNGNYFTDGSVIGVVVNFDTGSLEFFINGVSKGIATATGLLGKSVVPAVCDTAGYSLRNLHATLKINSFDFPVAGADPWAASPRIVIDQNIFRTYVNDIYSVIFPNAQAADGSFVPKQLVYEKLGNYLDPGKGVITGYAKVIDAASAAENLALSSLLFASKFNGANGSNVFIDEKGHNIITFGGCKVESGGVSAINPARRSVLYAPGDSGNGIRIPISSLQDPLNLSNGDFTIRTWFWLKADAIAGRYGIFSWGGGYNYSYANIRLDMRTNTSVAISLRTTNAGEGVNDIAAYQEIPNSFPGKDRWVHLAITRRGPLIRLWVDGGKKYEVSTPYPIHNSYNLTGIDIGSVGYDARIAPAPSDGATAYFDDFQIFNTCLYDADFTPDVTKEFSLDPVGVPVSRKIDLFRESDGMLVRQMWSDPITGIYRFEGLNPNYSYSVVGYDHTNQYKANIVNGRIASIAP